MIVIYYLSMSYLDLKENIFSMEWNNDGSMIGVTSKDKSLRIFDPRTNESVVSINDIFTGSKPSKMFWMNNLKWIGCTGFTKFAKRQLKFWDLRMLTGNGAESKDICSVPVGQQSSILMPHYDSQNGLLYLYGKGSNTIMYGEIINDDRKWYPLGKFASTEQNKGGAWIPKRCCDVYKCEIERFYQIKGGQTSSVVPVSFIVPRKTGNELFQDDIYPDCYAGKPAIMDNKKWLNGETKPPVMMSMDPQKNEDGKKMNDDQIVVFEKKKSYDELERENEKLRHEINELKAKVAELSKQK